MKSTDAAILQRDISKSLKKIKELIRDGVGSNEINTFYADKIENQVDIISTILNKMEY